LFDAVERGSESCGSYQGDFDLLPGNTAEGEEEAALIVLLFLSLKFTSS
jgi:hypothetical protein